MVRSRCLSSVSVQTAPEWDSEFKYSTIYAVGPTVSIFGKMTIIVKNGLDVIERLPVQNGEKSIRFQMDQGFLQLTDIKNEQGKAFIGLSTFSKDKRVHALYKLKLTMTAFNQNGCADKSFETIFDQGYDLANYEILLSSTVLEKKIKMEIEVLSKSICYGLPSASSSATGRVIEAGLLSRMTVNLTENGKVATKGPCTDSEKIITFKTEEASLNIKGCKGTSGHDFFELGVTSDDENTDVIYQLQIKVQCLDENGNVCKQFYHCCEQGARLDPYTCFIGDELKYKPLKVDVEIVHKSIDMLPTFEEGDVYLAFSNGTVLKTYKTVIGVHSTYLKELIGDDMNCPGPVTINLDNFSVDAIKELLYQVYSTKRPIWTNFKALALAATSFSFNLILRKLALHLVNYEELCWLDKMKEAICMGLDEAIIMLAVQASQTGLWDGLLASGMDPLNEFGVQVYESLIKPNVERGYSQMYHENLLSRCL
uniref:BTB domain-containing protein n=1 Tax=Rhabditophanes sp. KR3021 TaxID=114890 RepID=A0AC35UB09_9BILA